MAADTWRRQAPTAEILDAVDWFADLVADRVAERLTAGTKPTPERVGLSPREAAEALGMSESSVRKLVREGGIRAGQLGGRIVIHRSELDRLLLGAAS